MKRKNKIHSIKYALWKNLVGIILLMMPLLSFGQFSQDTVPAFDSLTVENDQDIDSTYFLVMDRWGKSIPLDRVDTDSVWNYWNHIPAMSGDNFYYYLGNTGSPAQSAYWKANREVGFDHGIHHLDLYRLRSDEIKYYSTGRAYTSIHYNQTPQQTKSETNLKFGRAFNTKSGISLQYDRINDLGEFAHQKTRQTTVGAGIFFIPKPNKKFFLSFISNNFTLEENGGIVSDSFYGIPTYDDRSIIPVNIQNSLATIKEREIRLTNSWNIGNKRDTVSRGLSLLYDGYYRIFRYKYSDPDSAQNTYQQYAVHEDGQRAVVENDRLSNKVGLAVDYGNKSAFDGRLMAHLEHQYNAYRQDSKKKNITSLLLHGQLDQQISERIRVHGKLILDLGDLRGDYLFNARLSLRLTERIRVHGYVISQLKTPTGILSEFQTLESSIYSNNFNASKYNTIGGEIEHKSLGLSGEINNTIVTDHVYFSADLQPKNISSTFNIFQIKLGFKRRFGALFTENHVYLQTSSDDRVPLPSYFSKNYIGTKFRLFKQRLRVDAGVDGIVLPNFKGYAYFPLAGQFYPSATTIPYQYTANGIFGFQVDNFRVYIKFENMQTIWDDTPRYLIEKNPLYDYRIRVGFRWLLRG